MDVTPGAKGQKQSRVPVIMATLLGWAALIASRRLAPVGPPLRPCESSMDCKEQHGRSRAMFCTLSMACSRSRSAGSKLRRQVT